MTNGENLYVFFRQNQLFSRKWWNLNDHSSYVPSILKYNLLGLHSRKRLHQQTGKVKLLGKYYRLKQAYNDQEKKTLEKRALAWNLFNTILSVLISSCNFKV